MTATISTESALLATIIERPAEDGPRLVYADWLEEHGECDRAEFIRVQIELADCPCNCSKCGGFSSPHLCTKELSGLRRREKELLYARVDGENGQPPHQGDNFYRWAKDAIKWFGRDNVKYSRGFVSQVTTTMAAWYGGRCRRCEGQGRLPSEFWPSGFKPCPTCHGGGHINAHGPQIVRATPIERVVCSDKRPMLSDATSPSRVWWSIYRDGQDAYCRLPEELFCLLKGDDPAGMGNFKYYRSSDLANAALSAAMIAWAKSVTLTPQSSARS